MSTAGLKIGRNAVLSLLVQCDAPANLFVSMENQEGGIYTVSFDVPAGMISPLSAMDDQFRQVDGPGRGLPPGNYVRLTLEAQGAGTLLLQRLSVEPASLFMVELE